MNKKMRLKIIDNNVLETCTVCVVNTMMELADRVIQYIEDSEGCCDLHVFQWDEKWQSWIAFTSATEAAEVIIHDLMRDYRRLTDHIQELNEEGVYQ